MSYWWLPDVKAPLDFAGANVGPGLAVQAELCIVCSRRELFAGRELNPRPLGRYIPALLHGHNATVWTEEEVHGHVQASLGTKPLGWGLCRLPVSACSDTEEHSKGVS